MEYKEAFNIAEDYFKRKYNFVVSKVSESEDHWIFSGCIEGEKGLERRRTNICPIVISKTSGDVRELILPSKEGFDIIRNAKVIYDIEKN